MKPDPAVVPWNVCAWLEQEMLDHSVDMGYFVLVEWEDAIHSVVLNKRENPFPYLSDERFEELANWLIEEIAAGVQALWERLQHIEANWPFLQLKAGYAS